MEMVGFVGNTIQDTFFNLININKTISFYVLILITLLFFLISINFNLKGFFKFYKKISETYYNK